jgi:hypothetical protein
VLQHDRGVVHALPRLTVVEMRVLEHGLRFYGGVPVDQHTHIGCRSVRDRHHRTQAIPAQESPPSRNEGRRMLRTRNSRAAAKGVCLWSAQLDVRV